METVNKAKTLMPPKKTTYKSLLDLLDRPDSKALYRLLVLFAVIGMTPLASMLPTIAGVKPLWERITDLSSDVKSTAHQLDLAVKRLDKLEAQSANVESKITKLESQFTGFQIDFERYKSSTPRPGH